MTRPCSSKRRLTRRSVRSSMPSWSRSTPARPSCSASPHRRSFTRRSRATPRSSRRSRPPKPSRGARFPRRPIATSGRRIGHDSRARRRERRGDRRDRPERRWPRLRRWCSPSRPAKPARTRSPRSPSTPARGRTRCRRGDAGDPEGAPERSEAGLADPGHGFEGAKSRPGPRLRLREWRRSAAEATGEISGPSS